MAVEEVNPWMEPIQPLPPKKEPKPIKILVVIEGGVLQSVLSSHPGIEVELRDWDNEDEENRPNLDTSNDEKEYPYEVY